MAHDFPLPDIGRARTIIDALGAMVVGEPCPACSGQGLHTLRAQRRAPQPASSSTVRRAPASASSAG